MRVKVVANNITWDITQDIEAIRAWFKDYVTLDFDIVRTSFSFIPFEPYQNDMWGVHRHWYDLNVAPLATGADICLFLVEGKQWHGTTARGWRVANTEGPVQLQVRVQEGEHFYINGVDAGSALVHEARHELLHALYLITCGNGVLIADKHNSNHLGCVDTTHYYWERHDLKRALQDWHREYVLSKLPSLAKLIGVNVTGRFISILRLFI